MVMMSRTYDEKPGIQAIATTAPDLPPEPGVHPTFARDHEYKRHPTLSLLAGINLLTVAKAAPDRHLADRRLFYCGTTRRDGEPLQGLSHRSLRRPHLD